MEVEFDELDLQIKAWCSLHWGSWRYRFDGGRELSYVEGLNRLGVILTNDTQGRPICEACTHNEERFLRKKNQS